MKNTIFLCLVLIMISCGKDDDSSGNNGNNDVSFISMKINGISWRGEANFYSSVIGGLLLAGTKKDNIEKTQTIAFTFPDININGINQFTKTGKAGLIYGDATSGVDWSAGNNSSGTGEITVTKSKVANGSLQVSANFNITTKDSKGNPIVITDGEIYNALAK